VPFSHLCPNDWVKIWRNQVNGLGELSFPGSSDKIDPVSHFAPSTDVEIEERINGAISSYTTESNKDIFKADMVFESFLHQTKILISDKA